MLSEQNQNLLDLYKKQIYTGEDIYVVYRYDKLDKDTMEVLIQIGQGIGVGLITEFAFESLITWGFGTIPSAISKIPRIVKAGKTTVAIEEKMGKAMVLIGDSVKYTKTAQRVSSGADDVYDASIIVRKVDDLFDVADSLDDARDGVGIANYVRSMADDLNRMGIDDISDLSEHTYDTIEEGKRLALITDDIIDAKKQLPDADFDQIAQLERQQEEVAGLLETTSNVNDLNQNIDLKAKIGTMVSNSAKVAAGTAGGIVGYNYNDNNRQYVDVMTKEQYFRLCGSEPTTIERRGVFG
jgi:hypothetical protein